MQVKTEEDEENEAPYLYRCPICLSSGQTGLVYDEGVNAEDEPESILRALVPAVELQGGIVEGGFPCHHRTCLQCATRWMRNRNQTTLPCPVCSTANSMPVDPENFLSRALMMPVPPEQEAAADAGEQEGHVQEEQAVLVVPSEFQWRDGDIMLTFNLMKNIIQNLIIFSEDELGEDFGLEETRHALQMATQPLIGETVILESIRSISTFTPWRRIAILKMNSIHGILCWMQQNWPATYTGLLREQLECIMAAIIIKAINHIEFRLVGIKRHFVREVLNIVLYSIKYWIWPYIQIDGEEIATYPRNMENALPEEISNNEETQILPAGNALRMNNMLRKNVTTIYDDDLFHDGFRFAAREESEIVGNVYEAILDL